MINFTAEDIRREFALVRYEMDQAMLRHAWRYGPPSESAGEIQVAKVTTEISAADGTGNATIDGRCTFIQHDDTGLASDGKTDQVVWNVFQAQIPVDTMIMLGKRGGRWYLIAADCDPQGPELKDARSTSSSLIDDIVYTPITPVINISRPGIYDFRYSVQLQATIPNNSTLAYQLQLWDATNNQELANSGPVGQTRAASGVVVDNGSFFADLDALSSAVDIQLRALDIGDGTLDSTVGDFLQSFGPL